MGGPFRNSINLLVNLLDVNDRDLLLSLFKQAYVKLETCVFVVHNLRVCAVCKMRCAIWLELGSGLVYGLGQGLGHGQVRSKIFAHAQFRNFANCHVNIFVTVNNGNCGIQLIHDSVTHAVFTKNTTHEYC